jgi:transcriptional regulator with XRE-family HTH domain
MTTFNTIVLSHVNTKVLEIENILVSNIGMTFSERVALARKHAKLSQEELANRIGCSQGLISKIERGDQDETGLIVKIANVTGVNPTWLDSGEGEMLDQNNFYLTPEMKAHLAVLQELPEYARTEVIRDAIKTAELITKATTAATKSNGTEHK